MIYFSFYETMLAGIVMLAFGASFSLFESFLKSFLKFILNIPFLITFANDHTERKKDIFNKIKIKYRAEFKNKGVLFLLDFTLIVSFCIFFLLLSYAFYDGILRIYFLFLALISYFFLKKYFVKKLTFISDKISLLLASICEILILLGLAPLIIILKICRRILVYISKPIKNKYRLYTSERISCKKITEIDMFFTKSLKP